jgi:hypothetical protein
MSEGHILVNTFRVSAARASSFPIFSFFAGAVDNLLLPDGMQSVNFRHCNLTGTAD